MKYRRKLNKKTSKRMFRKSASNAKKINYKAAPMRGGIRL